MPVEDALAIIDRDVPHKLDADARSALQVYVGQGTNTASALPILT
jgi:hypothetical protein